MKKKDPVREYLRAIGAKGGKNAAKKLTKAQRRIRALKAVAAREANRKRPP